MIADVYLKTDASRRTSTACATLIENGSRTSRRRVRLQAAGLHEQSASATRRPIELLGANPLPDTVPRHARKPDDIGKIRDALAPPAPAAGARVDPAIDEVRNREEDTNKILSVTRVVKLTMALLAALLAIASMLLIANTIRLSLYARRREVEVMKLVGATDWFIRWPFVLEGVLVGALGGVLAVLLLGGGQDRGRRPAGRRLRADRRAADDGLPAADRCPARRLDRGLRARLGHLAAPLPARLSASLAALRAACTVASVPRRSRNWVPVLVVLLPVLLVAGIWLGGHPDDLPGRSATRSSPTRRAASTTRRSARSSATTTARSIGTQLLDTSLDAAVALAARPLLALLLAARTTRTSRTPPRRVRRASA